jgi:hypothetical protein
MTMKRVFLAGLLISNVFAGEQQLGNVAEGAEVAEVAMLPNLQAELEQSRSGEITQRRVDLERLEELCKQCNAQVAQLQADIEQWNEGRRPWCARVIRWIARCVGYDLAAATDAN